MRWNFATVQLLYAYAEATVPMMTVVQGKLTVAHIRHGMQTFGIGLQCCMAYWRIGCNGSRRTVNIIHRRELKAENPKKNTLNWLKITRISLVTHTSPRRMGG